MNTTTTATVTVYSSFLLEQARKLRGEQEFEDFMSYLNSTEEARVKMNNNMKVHYHSVKSTLDKMASYGQNHWWILYKSTDEVEKTQELADMRKKLRVYFQVFDCGLGTMLIHYGQLANDINDLLASRGIVVTTWVLRFPEYFERYKKVLRSILDKDEKLQNYLREINSG